MRKRVYSLETEYAIAFAGETRPPVVSTSELYNQLERHILDHHDHARCDPTRQQAHGRAPASPVQIELLEGYFLSNGARLYWDSGHLEWSAPEAGNPYQALVYDRAAETELAEAVHAVQTKGSNSRIMIVKNNLDYLTNNTYGCHENYSVRRRSAAGRNVLSRIEEQLVPFLVTRQIICGAGRLGAAMEPFAAFQLSQRADFTSTLSSVQTREDRPIVNRRNEPLADETKYERLHLILGDSNLSECANFLKLGTTGLLLDAVEADAELPHLKLQDPIRAVHQVSRDLEFNFRLPLANGGTETALGIQKAYLQAAAAFVRRRPEQDPLDAQILALWDEVLQAIEKKDPELRSYLDWAGKRHLLERIMRDLGSDWSELEAWEPVLASSRRIDPARAAAADLPVWMSTHLAPREWRRVVEYMRRSGLQWSRYLQMRRIAAALRKQDILYHDIDPRYSLFHQFAEPFLLVEEESEIAGARQAAPADTRAAVRAQALHLAREQGLEIVLDWHQIHAVPSNTTVSLPDPLSNDPSALRGIFSNVRPSGTDQTRPKPAPSRDGSTDEITIDILSVEDLDPSNE